MGAQSIEGMRRFSTVRRCRVDTLEIAANAARVMDKFEMIARLCLGMFSFDSNVEGCSGEGKFSL